MEVNESLYPKAVCIFCEHCVDEEGDEEFVFQSDCDTYLCKKHPTQRTIHPVTGKPCYAFQHEEHIEWNVGSKYKLCIHVNHDGQCSHFSKIGEKEQKERKLSVGEQEEVVEVEEVE